MAGSTTAAGMTRKQLLRRIVNRLPRSVLKVPYMLFYYLFDGKEIRANHRALKEGLKRAKGVDEGNATLKRALKAYGLYMNRAGADKYLQSYFFCTDFECLKSRTRAAVPPNEAILICCVKDDLARVHAVYEHHKSIGIKHFAFVDNGSTDGTLEYLLSLTDVDVYQTHEPYHAGTKAAWTRKVQNCYGFNRWYLIVDSDELFSYVGMERHSINDLVAYAEQRGTKRVWGLLLDMYPKTAFFGEEQADESNFLEQYCYFDADSYYVLNDYKGPVMHGGPRSRLFESSDTPVSKFPLVYAGYEDVWADHTPMPFEKNFKSDCLSVLRHYKFLPEDKEKFRMAAKSGNYAMNSYEYKLYVKKIDDGSPLSFWNEKSCEYKDSQSLCSLAFLVAPFKEDIPGENSRKSSSKNPDGSNSMHVSGAVYTKEQEDSFEERL